MKAVRFHKSPLIFVLGSISVAFPSVAGGLVESTINMVAPGVGTALDEANRQIMEAVPGYEQLEKTLSNVVNEAFVHIAAPVLQELIERSRDDALAHGVHPVPANIRSQISGFIPEHILDIARFRVGGGNLTLQGNAFRYAGAFAITLDYVIVFRDQEDALHDSEMWVHELTHVMQYQDWNVGGFATRYVRSYRSVEKAAYDAESRYVAWRQSRIRNHPEARK